MITIVVDGMYAGILNEKAGHDEKPDFTQNVPSYIINILNTQANSFRVY
jgi:hypothetical protein